MLCVWELFGWIHGSPAIVCFWIFNVNAKLLWWMMRGCVRWEKTALAFPAVKKATHVGRKGGGSRAWLSGIAQDSGHARWMRRERSYSLVTIDWKEREGKINFVLAPLLLWRRRRRFLGYWTRFQMLVIAVISGEKRVQAVDVETPESAESHHHGFQLPTLKRGGGWPMARADAFPQTLVVGDLLPFLGDARSHGQRRGVQMLEYLVQDVNIASNLNLTSRQFLVIARCDSISWLFVIPSHEST